MDNYASGRAGKYVTVMSGKDMTVEAAVTKLSWLFGLPNMTLDVLMKSFEKNIRGELTEESGDKRITVESLSRRSGRL